MEYAAACNSDCELIEIVVHCYTTYAIIAAGVQQCMAHLPACVKTIGPV